VSKNVISMSHLDRKEDRRTPIFENFPFIYMGLEIKFGPLFVL
jgi:hypothetical protein